MPKIVYGFRCRAVALGLFSMLLGAAAVRAASATPATVAEANAAFESFRVAWEHKDLAAATAVFAPEAVVYDPVGPGVFATPEAIKGWTAGSFHDLDGITITDTDMKTHVSGQVAWTTMHFVFKATVQGKPLVDEGNLSLVWIKQADGAYKLAVFHASPPPPPPPPPPAAEKK